MAHDYSYRELQKMQEDAIRRVREMQARATIAEPEEQKKSEEHNKHNNIIEKPKNEKKEKTHKDKQNQSITTRNQQQHPQKQIRHNQRQHTNDFISKIPDRINDILQNDELCEQTLLIAIIMLLMNEKADNILILAILYILAD